MEKHYFAGATTHKGFVNFFEDIERGATYILKGVPGCGKNTLIKKVAEHFKDEPIEYFHCAADPDSLDGIRLVNHNILIVDGTQPHPIKKRPDIDKIINLTADIDIDARKLARRKKKHFEQAEKELRHARDAHKEIEKLYATHIDFDEITQTTRNLIQEIEIMILK